MCLNTGNHTHVRFLADMVFISYNFWAYLVGKLLLGNSEQLLLDQNTQLWIFHTTPPVV